MRLRPGDMWGTRFSVFVARTPAAPSARPDGRDTPTPATIGREARTIVRSPRPLIDLRDKRAGCYTAGWPREPGSSDLTRSKVLTRG
jgi:hypothetical protein